MACHETSQVKDRKTFWDTILHFFRSVHRRRHLDSLARLSNAQLADIGLRRGDLYESAALGLGEDVTTHLATIAENRRASIYRSPVSKN